VLVTTVSPPPCAGHHSEPSTLCWSSNWALHLVLVTTVSPPPCTGHHNKLSGAKIYQIIKKFTAFCRNWRFITELTTVPTCRYPQPAESTSSHPMCLGFIVLLFSYLPLGLPSGPFWPFFDDPESQRENQSASFFVSLTLNSGFTQMRHPISLLKSAFFPKHKFESCFIYMRNWVFRYKGRPNARWQKYLGLKFTKYYDGDYGKKNSNTAELSIYKGGLIDWLIDWLIVIGFETSRSWFT
jgi:hypothetical protein